MSIIYDYVYYLDMASLADILRSLNEKGIRQTVIDSRNAPGGILDKGRFHRASSDALVGDSNIYDPSTEGIVGNTVTNYVGGVQNPPLMVSDSKLYTTQSGAADTGTDPNSDPNATGGTGATWEPRFWEGVWYTDEAAYTAAVNQSILKNYNTQISDIDKMYQNGLITLDEREKQIGDTRKNLLNARNSALESQTGYFNRVSPNAYQSQQANYADKTNTQYNEANAQLGSENVGSYKTWNPEQINTYAKDLNEVGRLARDYLNLQTSKATNEQDAYNAYVGATDQNMNNFTGNVASPSAGIGDYSNRLNTLKSYYLNNGVNAPGVGTAFAYVSNKKKQEDPYSSFGG